jgi:hypothetical protein
VSVPGAADTGAPAPAAAQPAAGEAPPTSFKDIMAKIRSRATPETPRAAPAPAPVATKVEVPGDDLALKRVSRLEAENLELKDKAGKADAAEQDAKFAREIRKLYSEGKKMDALGLLAQADPTGEMEELLAAYLEKPTATAEAALAAKVDEALDTSKKALEASQRLQAEEAGRAKTAENQARLSFALSALDGAKNDDGSPRFELCARPENRGDIERRLFGYLDDAGVERGGHVQRLAIEQKVESKDVTPDLARRLIVEGFEAIEAELEAEGVEQQRVIDARFKRSAKFASGDGARQQAAAPQNPQVVGPPEVGSAQDRQREPQPRPMQRPPVRTDAPKPAWSLDAVMAKNRERARY